MTTRLNQPAADIACTLSFTHFRRALSGPVMPSFSSRRCLRSFLHGASSAATLSNLLAKCQTTSCQHVPLATASSFYSVSTHCDLGTFIIVFTNFIVFGRQFDFTFFFYSKFLLQPSRSHRCSYHFFYIFAISVTFSISLPPLQSPPRPD